MTNTDTQFSTRFPGMTASTFVAASPALSGYTPTTSPINTGMLSDIGRALVYAPEIQENFFAKFLQNPLSRGDSVMSARFTEVNSKAYDPLAADTALFDGDRPTMISNVAKKNLSRQIRVEVHDSLMRQFTQTEDMIGDVMSSIMAVSNVCYRDDMWVASKEYFSGSTRGALTDQMKVLSTSPGDAGFEDEMNEMIWSFAQNGFGYKSTKYNASSYPTKSSRVEIALKKDLEYKAFKKLYSETFNPEYLKVTQGVDYVDDFATPAGKPSGAGELLGIIADPRAWKITPMPETLITESFRNPARVSTAYFTTYEYAFQHDPFFNIAYIFAPSAAA